MSYNNPLRRILFLWEIEFMNGLFNNPWKSLNPDQFVIMREHRKLMIHLPVSLDKFEALEKESGIYRHIDKDKELRLLKHAPFEPTFYP